MMKKFFTITLAVIAAFMLTACSGKNLEDLIEVPDTDNTADSSETSTDKDGDTNNNPTETTDTTDTADTTDPTDEPTNPTDEPTNPTDEPTNPTDEPTNPTDEPTDPTEPTTDPTDEPTNPTDEPTNPTDEPTDPTESTTDPTDEPTNPTDPTTDPTDPFARCIEITLSNTELSHVKSSSSLSYRYDIFKTTYTPTPSATPNTFYLKLFGISENYDYRGNHELENTNWSNDDGYNNGLFLYICENEYCDNGKTYFQKAGNVFVSDIQINLGKVDRLYANLTGVVLEQVTIGADNTSNPVANGTCFKIKNDPEVTYYRY